MAVKFSSLLWRDPFVFSRCALSTKREFRADETISSRDSCRGGSVVAFLGGSGLGTFGRCDSTNRSRMIIRDHAPPMFAAYFDFSPLLPTPATTLLPTPRQRQYPLDNVTKMGMLGCFLKSQDRPPPGPPPREKEIPARILTVDNLTIFLPFTNTYDY